MTKTHRDLYPVIERASLYYIFYLISETTKMPYLYKAMFFMILIVIKNYILYNVE